MDIALSTLLIAILILPGIFFSRFYFSEEFSKQYIKSNLFEVFFASLVPSLIIHFLGYLLFQKYISFEFLAGYFSPDRTYDSIVNFGDNFSKIIGYMIMLSVVSGFLGWLAKYIVRTGAWDRKNKLFRYKNYWHYALTGEIMEFPRFNSTTDIKASDIDFTYIDALVDTSDGLILYRGMLGDYELQENGGLDLIYLLGALKREFKETGKEFSKIESEIFVLKYQNVLNFNISFYIITDEEK